MGYISEALRNAERAAETEARTKAEHRFDEVVAQQRARGRTHYGTGLNHDDGHDWNAEALQEAIDCAQYLAAENLRQRDELSRLRAENQRLTVELDETQSAHEQMRTEWANEQRRSEMYTKERDAAEQRATAAERDLRAEMDGARSLREQYGARDSETMFDFIARLYSGSCRADAAESALPAVREQCARLADELERTGRRMPNHACRECVPFSEILVDGFQCPYHAAIRAIPIEVKT